ncbi:hypothetical protein [Actinacidiphila glaucinigra]|uniref:hypothetical protein n=1 Tax=Actinacidiphila glaucinigra TaxID=235986 RepID=UPI002E314076|nr:hypothetical protein [Actinacidiphila glaucinigra]
MALAVSAVGVPLAGTALATPANCSGCGWDDGHGSRGYDRGDYGRGGYGHGGYGGGGYGRGGYGGRGTDFSYFGFTSKSLKSAHVKARNESLSANVASPLAVAQSAAVQAINVRQ